MLCGWRGWMLPRKNGYGRYCDLLCSKFGAAPIIKVNQYLHREAKEKEEIISHFTIACLFLASSLFIH